MKQNDQLDNYTNRLNKWKQEIQAQIIQYQKIEKTHGNLLCIGQLFLESYAYGISLLQKQFERIISEEERVLIDSKQKHQIHDHCTLTKELIENSLFQLDKEQTSLLNYIQQITQPLPHKRTARSKQKKENNSFQQNFSKPTFIHNFNTAKTRKSTSPKGTSLPKQNKHKPQKADNVQFIHYVKEKYQRPQMNSNKHIPISISLNTKNESKTIEIRKGIEDNQNLYNFEALSETKMELDTLFEIRNKIAQNIRYHNHKQIESSLESASLEHHKIKETFSSLNEENQRLHKQIHNQKQEIENQSDKQNDLKNKFKHLCDTLSQYL